jgi:hypothetical protein
MTDSRLVGFWHSQILEVPTTEPEFKARVGYRALLERKKARAISGPDHSSKSALHLVRIAIKWFLAAEVFSVVQTRELASAQCPANRI